MNRLEGLREKLIEGERTYTFVAIGLIFVIGLAYILFFQFGIAAQMKRRQQVLADLAVARNELLKMRKVQEEALAGLQKQVDQAQKQLVEVAQSFLTEAQAAKILDRLYQYASESGTVIQNLEALPRGEEAKPTVYDVRSFRLQAQGTMPQLADFVMRFKEAKQEAVQVSNVNIVQEEQGLYALTMDITLYTSPYARGKGISSGAKAGENLQQLYRSLNAAWDAENWQQAIQLLTQILTYDPEAAQARERLYAAHVNYGFALLKKGNTQEAAVQFSLALAVKPGGVEALVGLRQANATPAASPETPSQATPQGPVPTANPYLVRPKGWPTDWPWPPRGQ